jgi:hypothetical protein
MPTPANLGDIMKVSDMIVETATAAPGVEIKKGYAIMNPNGTGWRHAVAGPDKLDYSVCVALDNVTSDATERRFRRLYSGLVVAKKSNIGTITEGQKVDLGSQEGEFIASIPHSGIGECYKTANTGEDKVWIRLK